MLESLGAVYGFDAETKERGLTPEERLKFHQTHSAPVMEELHQWMEAQFAGAQNGTELRLGQGNLLFTEALDEADVVFAATGRPAR